MTEKDIKPAPRILIVEDSAIQAEMLRRILVREGYEAVVAGDGAEGLEAAQKQKPNLILSDINMPVMDGFEMCSKIKQDVALRDIPLILLTQFYEPEEVLTGLEAGADAYITKPYKEDYLLSMLRVTLENPRGFWNNPEQRSVEFDYQGKHYTVHSGRAQTLSFLISSYQSSIMKNIELLRTQEQLKMLNEHLEEKVDERTVKLEQEISERKKVEEALRKSNERFNLAVKGTNDGIWDWDIETNTNYFSSRFLELLDYGPDELAHELATFEFLLHPEDRAWVFDRVRQHLEDKVPYNVEYRMRTKNGEYKWFLARGEAIRDQSGKPFRMAGSITDITERRRAEAQLKNSEERHRQIVQTSMDGFWIVDINGRILDVNDVYCQMTGYAREELLNMGIQDVEAKETTEETAQHIQEIMTKGHARFETRHRRKDGQLLNIEASVVHRPGMEGECFFVFLRDITERKQADEKLRESENRFRLIAETITEVFWMADIEIGKIFYVSPAYEQIWGRSQQSLYENPHSFIEAIHAEDLARVLADFELEKTGQPFDHEYRIQQPDGMLRWIWDRGFPIHEPTGEVQRYVGIAQDITERKKAEEKLRKQLDELERFQNVAVRRELRMKELRDENESLNVRLADLAEKLKKAQGG